MNKCINKKVSEIQAVINDSPDTQLGDRHHGADSAYANQIKAKEDKVIRQMGGTIRIGKVNYDIKNLQINSDSVTILMQKGDSVKTYSFPFGSSTSLPTAKGKIVTTTYLHLYTEELKSSMPVNSNSSNKQIKDAVINYIQHEEQIENNRVQEETSSVMGSTNADADVLRKMQDGTYKRLTDKSAILSIIDMSFGRQFIISLIDAAKSNPYITKEYKDHALKFIESVTNAVKASTADDIQHRFEVYDTDNEFTTAFYGDSINGPQATGSIDGGMIVVLNGKNQSNISNNAELLLHEFTHSATELAMKQDGRLNRFVAKLQREVMKQLKYTHLLSHIQDPTVSEIQRAKELIRYINGDPSEFLAYTVSNPMVFHAINSMNITMETFSVNNSSDDGVIGTVSNNLKSIINQVISVSTVGPTASSALNVVLGDIVASNMRIKTKVYNEQTFDDYDTKITGGRFGKVDNFIKEGSKKTEKKLKELTEMSPATSRQINQFIDLIGNIKYIQGIKESGVIQSIMHTMFRSTTHHDFAASFQLIRKVKTDNDKNQNILKEINANLINGWYKDISAEQRVAITDLLAIDPNALGFSTKEEYAELLANPEKLDELIRTTGAMVKENEYLHQARDLGWYMIHGNSKNPLLQTNAHRIYYRMYNGSKQLPLGAELDAEQSVHLDAIKNIDKLASLYAMKYIDSRHKKLIVDLINDDTAVIKSSDVTDDEDYHVVDRTLKLYQSSVENERKDFVSYTELLDKGYLRKAYKRGMKSKIISEDFIKEMDSRGYTEKVFSQPATDMRNDGKRYYIVYSPDYSVSRTQGAIHDIGFFDKVQQMKDIYDGSEQMYEANLELVKSKTLSNQSYNGLKKKFSELSIDEMSAREDNLLPVMRLNGDIIDYSVPISRSDAEAHMELDMDIASVLSATITHRSSKARAIRGNIAVVNHLLLNSMEHEEDPDYVVLRKSTKEELASGKPYKYSAQWAMIPEYTRDYIFAKREHLGMSGNSNSILIHKDMIDDFIGYKDVSAANFKIGENGKYFNLQNHPATALKVEQFQYFLQKTIARYKTVLVILNPDAIIGNSWSNFNVASIHGIPPHIYAKLFYQHWKDLDDYNDTNSEYVKAISERDSGIKGLDNRILGLEKRLRANPMHELMEDGQFNMIIDDIDAHDNKEDHVQYHKRKLAEKIVGVKGAEQAKNFAENFILTKDSASFKAIEKLTAYNDIINRAIIRDKLLYDLSVDVSNGTVLEHEIDSKKREILNYVDQLFVNYSYLDNRYIKYANDVGLLLFTKYFFRSLKSMKQVYDKNPLALTSFLAFDNFIMDMEDPYDAYFNPIDSIEKKIGPTSELDFTSVAGKILMPGTFGIL